MKLPQIVAFCAALLFFTTPLRASSAPSLRLAGLRCEARENPLGIDSPAPRFSWVLQPTNPTLRGLHQSAYQILVAMNPGQLSAGKGDAWDSGKVMSSAQYGITYSGSPLSKCSEYVWKARAWDQAGNPSPWSSPATFVTAFLQPADWDPKLQWIRHPASKGSLDDPQPIFRKRFLLTKPIAHAYLYIAGLGQFVAYLNGAKIGDHVLDPPWTDYDQTVDYVTFDVTRQLKQGANTIGVMLGNGWLAANDRLKLRNFGPEIMRAQLQITYADGTSSNVISDTSWRVTSSPFTYTELHGAETYDARLEQPGWDTSNFNDAQWLRAAAAVPPKGALVAQACPPVVTRRTYSAIKILNPLPHVYIYDFGQNIDGQYEVKVTGSAGSAIEMLAGESLNPKGTINRGRGGASTYILKGSGVEDWRLTFSTLGFRYVQLSNVATGTSISNLPDVKEVKACATCTASPTVGAFAASNRVDQQICDMARLTVENNLTSIHTDGPNMEKLGWQEVAWTTPPASMYDLDLQNLLTKITRDIRDAQRASGLCPDIAPNLFHTRSSPSGDAFDDSPAWGSSVIALPWEIYFTYGDVKVLRDNCTAMKAYLSYLKPREVNGVIRYGLGDWLAPAGPNPPNVEGAVYVNDLRIMRDIARTLGNSKDAAFYSTEFARVRAAYNNTFFDSRAGYYLPVTQTNESLPLAFGIVPPGCEQAVTRALLADIAAPSAIAADNAKNGPVVPGHVAAGDIGCTFLWQVLGDSGHSDIIQSMITQPSVPSYRNMLDSGETTITELWDPKRTRSHDHDMYAGIYQWFYRDVAGISALKPGYEQIQIRPAIPPGVTSATATYNSIRGPITSSWHLAGDQLTLNVQIPPNTTATVFIPSRDASTITEGSRPAPNSPGVTFLDRTGSTALFTIAPGAYLFRSTLPWP